MEKFAIEQLLLGKLVQIEREVRSEFNFNEKVGQSELPAAISRQGDAKTILHSPDLDPDPREGVPGWPSGTPPVPRPR